jgi:hypothetical protein
MGKSLTDDGEEIRVRTMTGQCLTAATIGLLGAIANAPSAFAADRSQTAHIAAVEKLVDQKALAKVALENMDGKVRKAAVDRLTDQPMLAKVALEDGPCGRAGKFRFSCQHYDNDPSHTVRVAAIEKLNDQMVLAKVALVDEVHGFYGHPEKEIPTINDGLAAIKRITDQTTLATVATEAQDYRLRAAAVEKLDQATQARLALEGQRRWTQLSSQQHARASIFIGAAKDGNLSLVEDGLYHDGVPVDWTEALGATALMFASESGHLEIVRFLLDKGANLNASFVSSDFVLMPNGARAIPGVTTTAREIASRFPGSVIVRGSKETALSLAVKNGHTDVAAVLEAAAR